MNLLAVVFVQFADGKLMQLVMLVYVCQLNGLELCAVAQTGAHLVSEKARKMSRCCKHMQVLDFLVVICWRSGSAKADAVDACSSLSPYSLFGNDFVLATVMNLDK